MRRLSWVVWLTSLIAIVGLQPAFGQDFPAITSRDFALDLFEGAVIGTSRVVAMGGASMALAEGSAGSLSNPSATAIRATTDSDWFNWDFHAEVASQKFTSDFDNNGLQDSSQDKAAFTAGLSFGLSKWGIALGVTQRSAALNEAGTQQATLARIEVAVSYLLSSLDVGVGMALRVGSFAFNENDGNELFNLTKLSVVAGATWMPRQNSMRLAATVVAPSFRGKSRENCDPSNCQGFILPEQVAVPVSVATALAYRFGATPWNIKVPSAFRDERSLLVTAEINVTGPSKNAFGIEAFSRQLLQRSGIGISISPRVGFEYEWLPGRLRLRSGSYWEPARFENTSGRVHGTAGFELAMFGFRFWGPRRATLTFTADVASNYVNGGASIGLWH
jgi:hypothetical protein